MNPVVLFFGVISIKDRLTLTNPKNEFILGGGSETKGQIRAPPAS
jgi:hypothetical protein